VNAGHESRSGLFLMELLIRLVVLVFTKMHHVLLY